MPGLEEGVGGLGDLLTHDPPQPPTRKLEVTWVQRQQWEPMPLSPLQPTIADFLNLAWWTSAAAW